MNEIVVGKQTFFCPENFQEIEASKFKHILKLIFDEDNYLNRWKILQILAHIPSKFRRLLREEQLLEMLELLDFIYFRDDLPILEKIEIEKEMFYFPVENMTYSSVIEFAIADQYASEIIEGNYDKLDNFFFTLVRPHTPEVLDHKFTGDIRERFNAYLIDKRVKELSKLVPIHYKIYLFFWFLNVKKEIKNRYSELFKKSEKSENEENQVEQPEILIIGWLKLIKSISETGIYGNYDDTCHYSFHNFCLNLCFDYQLKEKQKSSL
jgi:hypothetical protein